MTQRLEFAGPSLDILKTHYGLAATILGTIGEAPVGRGDNSVSQ